VRCTAGGGAGAGATSFLVVLEKEKQPEANRPTATKRPRDKNFVIWRPFGRELLTVWEQGRAQTILVTRNLDVSYPAPFELSDSSASLRGLSRSAAAQPRYARAVLSSPGVDSRNQFCRRSHAVSKNDLRNGIDALIVAGGSLTKEICDRF
jgi:hypothetical protein